MNSASLFVQRRSAVCVAFLMMTGRGSRRYRPRLSCQRRRPRIDRRRTRNRLPDRSQDLHAQRREWAGNLKFREPTPTGTSPTDLRTRVSIVTGPGTVHYLQKVHHRYLRTGGRQEAATAST